MSLRTSPSLCRLSATLLVFCLVWLGLSGCTPQPPALLRVGSNVWVGYEPLYLARSLGLYDDKTIRLVEHGTATDVMRGLLDGDLEAGAVTLDEALTLLAQGLDLKVVLVFDYSAGADAVVARPGIANARDLKGKRIGVESGAVGAVMLEALRDAAGLGLNDVTKVPISAAEQVSSYQAGLVDAVVAFEPNVSRLRQLGGHVVFDSREIPGRILDVLVVRSDVLPRHADNLRTLLRGYFAALAYLKEHPEDAHTRMAARQGNGVATQLTGIHQPGREENQALLSGLDQQAQQFADFLAHGQLLPRTLVVPRLADAAYLPR